MAIMFGIIVTKQNYRNIHSSSLNIQEFFKNITILLLKFRRFFLVLRLAFITLIFFCKSSYSKNTHYKYKFNINQSFHVAIFNHERYRETVFNFFNES